MPPLNNDDVSREQLAGKAYWRSLQEYAHGAGYAGLMAREASAAAGEAFLPSTRRGFLQLMGASLALAGLTLSGCRPPKERITPYASQPTGFTSNTPVSYATAMELAGIAVGLLVTAYDGRPIKIEGNPSHPGSLGGASALHQASVFELYDPDRSKAPIERQGGQALERTMSGFTAFASAHFAQLRTGQGRGLAILREQSSSPSMLLLGMQLQRLLPAARWFEYEAVPRDNARLGTALAFFQPHCPLPKYDKAELIVSLDDDFLCSHPNAVRFARDFAAGRQAEAGRMSRLYVVESAHSLTGANADHRIAVRPGDVASVACIIAAELVLNAGLALPAGSEMLKRTLVQFLNLPLATPLVKTLAQDLYEHRGRSVITVGPSQPPEIHALACLLNEALGNVEQTLDYVLDPDQFRQTHEQEITQLCSALGGSSLDTLLILGGNPAFDVPANLGFAELLAKVQTSIHLSLYDDETSQLCTWHVPRAHYLEAWGDARALDGTLSVVQPVLAPLYGGMSAIEMLALVTGDKLQSGYDIVRRTLGLIYKAADAEAQWKQTLMDGVLAGSTWPIASPNGNYAELGKALEVHVTPGSGDGMSLLFTSDASVYDGRFGNNGWLQELPGPLTRLTWGNAVLISPEDAREHKLKQGDAVTLSAGDRRLEAPVYIMPGQAKGCLSLSLGYGRQNCGQVGNGVGENANALRSTDAWIVLNGVELQKVNQRYKLASVEEHFALDTEHAGQRGQPLSALVREGNLEEYRKAPDFARQGEPAPAAAATGTATQGEGPRWAMAIDLNRCTGCGACVVACMAENNVPVVGKDNVARAREMQWLRVERYFEGPADSPRVVQQPLACQQCDSAPCEPACPVKALAHQADKLNEVDFNRCIGARKCIKACPYKVLRFNSADYYADLSESERQQLNLLVTARRRGVIEKCSYCIQRIHAGSAGILPANSDGGQDVRPTAKFTTACAQTCPSQAITFGDLNDAASAVRKLHENPRAYVLLSEKSTQPRTAYLAKLRNPAPGTP